MPAVFLFFFAVATCAHGGSGVSNSAGIAEHPDHEQKFASFIETHDRSYRHGTREFEERFALWGRRSAEVEQLNSRPHKLWTATINVFSDRTEDELRQLRGWKGGASPHAAEQSSGTHGMMLSQTGQATPIPSEFMNWTKLSSLKTVKNQGSCGSCWAVAASTLLETHAEIYSQKRTFATQELVDCVPNPHRCGGKGGCEGATVELALIYALNRGLSTEAKTPYTQHTGKCRKNPQVNSFLAISHDGLESLAEEDVGVGTHAGRGGHVAGMSFGMHAWQRLPENKYEPLLRAVMDYGPVGVSVAAGGWFAYESGVFNNCEKDAVIDHAVTLIGFGKDHDLKKKFWLIRNSWGSDYGEQGNIRILRHDSDDEHCGIDHQPEVGTACTGGPKQVPVCGMCGILYDSALPHFKKTESTSSTKW